MTATGETASAQRELSPASRPAALDTRSAIEVRGLHKRFRIPKNRITVFVGVSGSGKSSLVFDTIAVEAQRQLNATFPWFIQNQLPKYERPHVDAIEHLTTPVIVDQRGLSGNARSTVGTITDIYSMMRVLFAHFGDPRSGLPSLYSFNDPQGMCPVCEGLGQTLRVDPDLLLD